MNNHPNNFTVYDSKAPLSHFEKNGYYTVGNYAFNYKINALEYATRENLPVEWNFNTELFKSLNWRQSTNTSLTELYKLRAQQLRNQYDYLALAFSGGSDCYTVLKVFLDNNIKLDEIICDWSISATEKLPVSYNQSAENYVSEWALAIKPMLEYVGRRYPDIKITVSDSTETLTMEDFEDTCTITQHHNYISVKRYRKIADRLKELNSRYPKVALMLGTEKPRLTIDRNVLTLFFSDAHCWFKSDITDYERNAEYFFWSADMPEIMIEQAHVIYKYLQANASSRILFQSPLWPEDQREVYQHNQLELIKTLIYPYWDPRVFQAVKGSSPIYNPQYSYLFEHRDSIEVQSWESSVNSRIATVDPKYIKRFDNGKFFGYKDIYSRLYPIGVLK